MAKKNTRAADVRRRLAEEEKDPSPFAGVVLKEKVEEKPARKVVQVKAKKPGEIVQGYDPSASFADILQSFETTGDPYTLKKSKTKAGMTKKTSFGDILDQWEGKARAEKAKSSSQERKSPAYKPSKSFGDILNAYEGVKAEPASPERKEEVPPRKPSTAPYKRSPAYKGEKSFADILDEFENPGKRPVAPVTGKKTGPEGAVAKDEEPISYTETLFKTPSEGEEKATGASWSIFGGRNESYVRPEKPLEPPKKPERRSEPYKPTKSFGEILGKVEGIKAPEVKAPAAKGEAVSYTETLFKTPEDDEERAKGASWSVFGGNEGFVREEKPQVKEEEKPEEPVKSERVSPAYKPTKSFEDILSDYAVRKAQRKPAEPRKVPAVDGEGTVTLFKKPEDGSKRAEGVAWSIYGDNHQVRRQQPAAPVKDQHTDEKGPDVHDPYEPTRAFSDILTEYDNTVPRAEKVKTFEEMMREKAEAEKPRRLTIGKLRSMLPQSTLDLHGMTVAEAEAAVTNFLSECNEHGLRKISIITGKGLHSEDGVGVLKDAAEGVLDKSGLVREKSPAPMNAGGSGALWVILKEEEQS